MISTILLLVFMNPVSLTNTQAPQIHRVEKRLLAPCCYTQSIAEHGSDIAVQMRSEVTEMVTHGKSEEEIVNHYRIIYGDRVLIIPDGLTGKILFTLPVAISALGCLALLVSFRKMLRSGKKHRESDISQSQQALNDVFREKIEREIGDPL